MKKITIPAIKSFSVLLLSLILWSCEQGNSAESAIPSSEASVVSPEKKESQEAIIKEYHQECALNFPLYSQERQKCLDAGLEKDPTIAYLWQQKAMPLFKQRKYEAGMEFIDKAVEYDPQRYLPYRAFIKCIFAKTYRGAITDFEECLDRYGNSYVMDHTYKFHIALSYLQLNEFEKAESIFAEDIQEQREEWGEDGAHHLDLFYYGISKYEQGKYEEAIEEFDQALKLYPDFAEVQYYKSFSLMNLGKEEEAMPLFESARKNGLAGNTINEDNVIYEQYPYQLRWR